MDAMESLDNELGAGALSVRPHNPLVPGSSPGGGIPRKSCPESHNFRFSGTCGIVAP